MPFLLICGEVPQLDKTKTSFVSIFTDAFQGRYKHEPFYSHFFQAVFMICTVYLFGYISSLGFKYYHAAASLMLMVIIVLVAIARPSGIFGVMLLH